MVYAFFIYKKMKTFRFIGMAVLAILMCVNFTACSDSDGGGLGSSKGLLGTWTSDVINYKVIPWVYTFNADGTYTTKSGVYENNKGRYTYKHPILTLSETDGGTTLFTIISFEKDLIVMMSESGNSITLYKGTKEEEKQTVSGKVQNHDYVDLGLSVKWATCNVGASNITNIGDEYAWGETYTKKEFTWENYKWCNSENGSLKHLTKYVTEDGFGELIYSNDWYDEYFKDYLTTLEASDDAATAKWGSKWRTPTKEESEELIDKCSWDIVNFNGYVAWKVTGPSGKSIFFVAEWPDGYYHTDWYSTSTLDEVWNQCAYNFRIQYYNEPYLDSNGRDWGCVVRPVTE